MDPIRFGKRELIKSQYNHPIGPARKTRKGYAAGMLDNACYCESCRALSPAKAEAWAKQRQDVLDALRTL